MAESFLAILADQLLNQIASLFADETALARGLKPDLSKLQTTLKDLKSVILDAEEAQLTSHEVRAWLGQLKDVLFDAEDLFDEFGFEAFRKQLVNSPTNGGTRKKVRRFLSSSSNPIAYRLRMRRKVREIREAFDEVAANKTKLHLPARHNEWLSNSVFLLNQRELSHDSFVNRAQVIGRDGDRDTILDSLLSPIDHIAVVSVVGIGGMGKTALATMVFDDVRIANHFEEKIWVCLGDLNEFSLEHAVRKIAKLVLGEFDEDLSAEQLQSWFCDGLCDKRFLLVLDDVWAVDRAEWLKFRELLMCSANGSRVMVTTRNSSVSVDMGSTLTHSLHGLPHEECVSLFRKCAFEEGEDDRNLMRIGDVLVGKCKGIPLAVKTLGCLLFSRRNIVDWIYVRDSEIWKLDQNKDGILPALKISYNLLPFILKQCFLYCSIFPKDHEFANHEFIAHWSSCGLLRTPVLNKKFEGIAQQYVNELYARGFFQDFKGSGTFGTFKLHNMFHDLASSVAQNELKFLKGDRQDKEIIGKRIRYVSFSRREGLVGADVSKLFLTKNSRSSCVMPVVSSMFLNHIGESANGTFRIVKTCISELKNLRMLDLSNTWSLEQLPSSIGSLKHLVFLDLDGCSRLKKLPDSICQLYSLQSLSMERCEELEELPKDIGDLGRLRYLEIATKQRRLSEGVGNGVESLTSLEQLSLSGCVNLEYVFESAKNDDDHDAHQALLWKSFQTMSISNCGNLKSLFPSTASKKELRVLSGLEKLSISNCPNINLASLFNDRIKLVRLRWLVLGGCPEVESLPEWIGVEGCATTLELLGISDCPNLTSLPEWLHKLASLSQLVIGSCPKLLSMPEGLRGLKELHIDDCPELSRRCERGVGEDWPNIEHIPKIVLDGELQ